MEKKSWKDIPSLENLEVDWEYSPENPLGKRKSVRISNIDLFRLLDVEYIPIKIVSRTFSEKGYLIDISENGLAALVDRKMQEGEPVNVGLFLGKHKMTSKAVVRNFIKYQDHMRVGIEFVSLLKEHAEYIVGMNASNVYGHKR